MNADDDTGAQGEEPTKAGPTTLGAEDARAVDALIEHGFDAERATAAHPELAERIAAARSLFGRLEAPAVEPPDPTIVDATLARITREESARESRMFIDSGREPARAALGSGRWKDFIAVACVAIMVLAAGMPLASWLRGRSIDARCSENMRSIASALDIYTKDHASMPFAAGLGADFASLLNWRGYQNSGHLDPLSDHNYCDPACLCCAGAPNGSGYAFQVPSRLAEWRWRGGARVPVLSDRNPIVDFERRGMRVISFVGNSPDHDGRGENMLFTDGSVEFVVTPVLVLPRGGAASAGKPTEENVWLPGTSAGTEMLDSPKAWPGLDVFLLH
ncbi:MAG: hypothetical protein ACKO0W_08555 [Planctomycetota bacterium]